MLDKMMKFAFDLRLTQSNKTTTLTDGVIYKKVNYISTYLPTFEG